MINPTLLIHKEGRKGRKVREPIPLMRRRLEIYPFIINVLEREIPLTPWKWFSWNVSIHHHKDSPYPHFIQQCLLAEFFIMWVLRDNLIQLHL